METDEQAKGGAAEYSSKRHVMLPGRRLTTRKHCTNIVVRAESFSGPDGCISCKSGSWPTAFCNSVLWSTFANDIHKGFVSRRCLYNFSHSHSLSSRH